ncbi:MAG: cytochrome c biogenesis factor [Erythrobacter sp. SCN 62-14]|nr:MAG: cytochrome c biogenesis factor [Erythrobacter sp. SCN 62-14]
MIQGWLAIGALALGAFALAAFLLRLPRDGFALFAAVLIFGLAGYAWQGSPGQPAQPTPPQARGAGAGEAMVEGRRALFEDEGPASSYLITSDGFARRGKFAEAAGLLRRGLAENPADLEGWLALGMALVGHAEGNVTPAAVNAFEQARRVDPNHPGAEYFLGFAYLQSGEIRNARNIWAGLLDHSPPNAPWRDGLEAQIADLDRMIANAPMLQQ